MYFYLYTHAELAGVCPGMSFSRLERPDIQVTKYICVYMDMHAYINPIDRRLIYTNMRTSIAVHVIYMCLHGYTCLHRSHRAIARLIYRNLRTPLLCMLLICVYMDTHAYINPNDISIDRSIRTCEGLTPLTGVNPNLTYSRHHL